MFWYIIGGILISTIGLVLYILYRGYARIKPKPLDGIPIPPMTHSILGHPDKMLSPLKHELRLEVTETANGPYHQLVLMKHSSIFINDSVEAVRVLNTLPEKGPIYDIFRYDKKVPDTLASDGDDWKQRSTYLRSALMNTKVLDTDLAPILKQFDLKLNEYAESGKPLDLNEIITLLSMDVVTKSVFQYDLNALSGSEEGARLYKCLTTLSDYQASQGPYANPKIKKVTQEEIKAVTTDWRKFLNKLVKVLQSEARIYKNLHGNLNHENSFIHALVNYMQQQSKFGEDEMLAEIHQAFRHGHECLAGTLLWACYSLYKNPYMRAQLETEVSKSAGTNNTSEYLDSFIQEVFRRYPTSGNLTVRTVSEDDYKLGRGHHVPKGIPVHVHMWTLHNGSRDWYRPRDFLPERWMKDNSVRNANTNDGDDNVEDSSKKLDYPKCPFINTQSVKSETTNVKEKYKVYEGAGFVEGSVCFFPFSAGPRSCPAKIFAVDTITKILSHLLVSFRIDPHTSFWEQDPGQSSNAIIIPLFVPSTSVKVQRALNLGEVPEKQDEGWAEDNDEDEFSKVATSTTSAGNNDQDEKETNTNKVENPLSSPIDIQTGTDEKLQADDDSGHDNDYEKVEVEDSLPDRDNN